MRRPCEVDRTVDEEQAGALFLLCGVKDHESAGTIVAGAGIPGGDFDGTVETFGTVGGVESVQALVIVAGAVFRHGNDIDDRVAFCEAKDDGSGGDSNLRRDLRTTAIVGSGFAGQKSCDMPAVATINRLWVTPEMETFER